jgi:hypothetical protein
VHFGYNETAMAMLRESALEEKALSQKNGESMQQRKSNVFLLEICSQIIGGSYGCEFA